MGGFAAPLMAGGALLGAYGQYQEGREQEANLKTQSKIARRNAEILRAQARTARQQAGLEEEAQRRESARFMGTQRAAVGQSGIGFGGTAAQLLEDTAIQSELDALNIRYGGELQAADLLTQAGMEETQAQILKKNAKAAKRAGTVGAATSLLSFGANAYGSGMFKGGGGRNMQGQSSGLLSNPAYVRNM